MTSPAPRALAIQVRFVDGRYHGEPEWPPAPARLYQALVAAAATPDLAPAAAAALRWLEALPAPIVAAPFSTTGTGRKTYVPNNDLDAKGGDPAAVASIRSGKLIRPRIFDGATPLVYAWRVEEPADEGPAVAICQLADALYQLGRGVDVAHASGALLTGDELDRLLAAYRGEVLRPTPGAARHARELLCPCRGSLARLGERHSATLTRFGSERVGRKRITTFRQPPKPLFTPVIYESPPARALFELRPSGDMSRFAYTPATGIVSLTERLRDAAAEQLRGGMPDRGDDIERALIGRAVDGLPRLDVDRRVRLLPLPSIGSQYADRGVRRLLVEVPAACPLRSDDVFWAFSNLLCDNAHGAELRVTQTSACRMASHYGVDVRTGHRRWRSVTAAALPLRLGRAARSSGAERTDLEDKAHGAVRRALRHAGVRAPVEAIRVQREPFEAKGSPAAAFAEGTRFSAGQLWHIELLFRDRVAGPLVIGNGRFLGLGILAPVTGGRPAPWVFAFRVVSGLAPDAEGHVVALALRRAVMARYQAALGPRGALPAFVTGHEADGGPTGEPHLSFAFDPVHARLLVVVPPDVKSSLDTLATALDRLTDLRAGASGHLRLQHVALDPSTDPLLAPSSVWVSSTPYVVNRHIKSASAADALRADLEAACRARGLPDVEVRVLEVRGVAGTGLTGRAELRFDVAVSGPLLLGRTRHKGGGLFRHPAEP